LPYPPGAFYGQHEGLNLGAGLIYSGVRQPAFDFEKQRYVTIEATSYVITHECDVATENARPLSDSLIVCPLIPFEAFIEEHGEVDNLKSLLVEMAKRHVYRAIYLPPLANVSQFGAVLYLNLLTTTHVSAFGPESKAQAIGAVSGHGLREIDVALQNLLLREKSDRLWGMYPNSTCGVTR